MTWSVSEFSINEFINYKNVAKFMAHYFPILHKMSTTLKAKSTF